MATLDLAARDWELWTTACRLVVTDPQRLDEATALADALLAEVEVASSRFRPDSEVLGLRAGWNDLSPMLADLVREALTAAWLSDGAVDPTGRRLDGRARLRPHAVRRPRRHRARGSPSCRPRPAGARLRLDGDRLFRPAHVQLDLGATAKAVAADRTAALVADAARHRCAGQPRRRHRHRRARHRTAAGR